MVILLAAAFMAIGLVNLDFGANWWRGQRQRLVVGIPILLVYAYLVMPPLVFPQALTLLLLTLVPNAAYSLLLAARSVVISRRIVSIRRTPTWPYLIALTALALFAGALAIAPVGPARSRRRHDVEHAAAER